MTAVRLAYCRWWVSVFAWKVDWSLGFGARVLFVFASDEQGDPVYCTTVSFVSLLFFCYSGGILFALTARVSFFSSFGFFFTFLVAGACFRAFHCVLRVQFFWLH